jgi:membrane protein YdbS with pleckstrin-like domain
MDNETKLQFVTTFSALITAAFGLVAALAWNDAISMAVGLFFKNNGEIWGKLIYAILVTILAVVMVIIISRNAKKLSDQIKGSEKKE